MAYISSSLFGCSGLTLTAWERAFFRDVRPWGYILFGRNIETPEQVRALTHALREASDDPDALVFVDQEGGSVARFKGEHFRHPPAGHQLAELYRKDPEVGCEAAWLNARLIADELKPLGVNANFAPVLDVVAETAHPFLQSRALGRDARSVSDLGKATAIGLREGGMAPVIKHAPGHGRGDADSHLTLPVVKATRSELENVDFAPFLALQREAMLLTAHVLYTELDTNLPGTLSPTILKTLIRTEWSYDGLIISDDINMNALGGTIEERSAKALAAGCDIICHCNGEPEDMQAVAAAAQPLTGETLRRASRARSIGNLEPRPFDQKEATERLKALDVYEAQSAATPEATS
ncbi:MAG: beta-N-acetylhexosaminidase [Pseudomonadota bacterium]